MISPALVPQLLTQDGDTWLPSPAAVFTLTPQKQEGPGWAGLGGQKCSRLRLFCLTTVISLYIFILFS